MATRVGPEVVTPRGQKTRPGRALRRVSSVDRATDETPDRRACPFLPGFWCAGHLPPGLARVPACCRHFHAGVAP